MSDVRKVRAEAAAWLARLHGPNRTPEVEAGFLCWLSEDPERAAAFEHIIDTWGKSACLRRRPFEGMTSGKPPGFRRSLARATLATIGIATPAIIGAAFYLHNHAVTIRVGEQRALPLEDAPNIHEVGRGGDPVEPERER